MLGEKTKDREMRMGLQAGENDSEELISHSAKAAVVKTSSSEKDTRPESLSLSLSSVLSCLHITECFMFDFLLKS